MILVYKIIFTNKLDEDFDDFCNQQKWVVVATPYLHT